MSTIQAIADAVEPEDVDLGDRTSPDGAMTIVFSDIERSTELLELLGEERWMELLHAHNAIVREHVARYGGSEVKSQGDGFMLAFSSSRAGLHCVMDMQRVFEAWSRGHPDAALRVRIGLHSGFMIQEGEDYFGRNVILAARIADSACGGEILVSSMLREFVERDPSFRFEKSRELELKGLSGTHVVHAVDWRDEGLR